MSTGIIFGNRILDVAVIACFAAQFYKVFSPLFKGRGASWVRLFQTGGMPSSHASTVVALATSLALLKGMRSVEFAISMVFSSIVLYDATGIRRAAGEHAKALNRLVKSIEHKDDFEKIEANFKEFLGHTPLEVFWGCVLGLIIGIAFRGYLLG
ncbi:Divergent PAP2 family [Sebaldella termitidis]|jgi:acid phosphatase family membrane protein YuiD|uniref:Acid phosphatase/vanadium-dependent haloperoxidase related protein n=1 Tax=Sebaldella termitidis (strain ATCC 33386 / NCTC 11300) TaxID=526218 RepID=D1AKQ0_SEBTE|nr:divergent PAP2 family protein [Sebaldella termitidis]ACZ07066.1 acid phosphatase/vanadium-dependent haloperoxidase related protein [Sebaldella termitidis ATCC 33386]MBP7979068.1 divergent PAP2 family protein [Sebaldella sp.]SUI22356.1 Divergent PAP2 family [Sebaldella termitidis]